MTDIRTFHQLGELRLMFDRRAARAVINAYKAHGEIVCVDPTTGAEVPGRPHVNDQTYVDPEVWVGMVRVAGECQDRLETIDDVHDARARIAGMARNEKHAIKKIKEWCEWADREEIELRKTRDAIREGQLTALRAEVMQDLSEYEDRLSMHSAQIAMCDDVLQRI